MNMEKLILKDKTCLYIVIAATVISIVYWTMFGINAYNTFHEYSDLGFSTMSYYYHLNYPGVMHGFEYLVFWNHISPDQILLLPVFWLYQSSLTLLFLQALGLSLVGLLLFFVVKDLAKSSMLGLIFGIVYLLNPGMFGMLVFDYHAEFLIIPFFVLTFYFYMKLNKPWFLVSLLLLLGSVESAPFLALPLGVGLFLYDFSYTKEKHIRDQRFILAASIIIITLFVIAFESYITSSLVNSYSTSYANLPTQFMVSNSGTGVAGNMVNALTGGAGTQPWYSQFDGYLAYALLFVLFGFGMLILFDPVITLIFDLPWLSIVFLLHDMNFFVVWNQYFSYVLGGVIVGAIIGLMMMKERKGVLAGYLHRKLGHDYDKKVIVYVVVSIIFVAAVAILLFPSMVYSKNVNNLGQDFLFMVGPKQAALDSQMNSLLALVPKNASLITDFYIVPHVATRKYMEQFNPSSAMDTFFTPQYALIDLNENISLNSYIDVGYAQAFFANNTNYRIYAYNGTGYLLEYNGTAPAT
jgi:uncharacterized membrane protein